MLLCLWQSDPSAENGQASATYVNDILSRYKLAKYTDRQLINIRVLRWTPAGKGSTQRPRTMYHGRMALSPSTCQLYIEDLSAPTRAESADKSTGHFRTTVVTVDQAFDLFLQKNISSASTQAGQNAPAGWSSERNSYLL